MCSARASVHSPGDLEGLLNYSEQNVNVSDVLELGWPHLTLIRVEFHCCLMGRRLPLVALCPTFLIIRKTQSLSLFLSPRAAVHYPSGV